MRFGPRRAHFMFLFQNIFGDFGLLMIFLFVGIVTRDFSVLLDNVVLIAIVFLAPVARLIAFFNTIYSADNEFLIIESGLINKKKTKIPINSITNIDFTQPLIMQLANVYVLNIDNASKATQETNKIRIVFKEEDAFALKKILLGNNSDDGIEKADNSYEALKRKYDPAKTMEASILDIFFLGLLKSSLKMMFNGFWIMVAALPVLNSILEAISVAIINEEAIIKTVLANVSGLTSAVIMMALILAVGTILNVIINMVKYASFKIVDMGSNIHVEYGLLNRKQHTLVKTKICGVKFRQSLWMKIFAVGYVEVIAIGYGDSEEQLQSDISLLFPMLKARDFDGFVDRWMPQLNCDVAINKVNQVPLRFFVTTKSFFISLSLLVASFLFKDLIYKWTSSVMPAFNEMVICIFGFWFIIVVICIFIERSTNGIGYSDKVIKAKSGSLDSSLDYVLIDRIEYLTGKATKLKFKRGFVNLDFGILGPSQKSVFKVRNINVNIYEKLKLVLKY